MLSNFQAYKNMYISFGWNMVVLGLRLELKKKKNLLDSK